MASRRLGLTLVMGLGFVGCGGSSSPSPVSTPTPNLTTTLPTVSFSNLDINGVFSTDVNVTVSGSITVVGDWTLATDDVDVYVTDTSCDKTEARLVRQFCTLLGKADTYKVKPKRLTMNVTPAMYRVFVANFGPTAAESGTLQISITRQP
jgi:hypothetical protein